ncbi:MAG: arylsulfatase [Deltaproteobacteria bacterium]|nr:arylsulfatase [Deltaproteobacteria bacterium]MBW2053632.1 arylsulfatase [Deltaproteobacteria bacterium]
MSDMNDFGGIIGRTIKDSKPGLSERPRPREGAPNVVIILFDDTGFSHFGCYGSSIETPNIDRLAANGLRYTNFHTTALCSPTRASLLTGRNHHSVGMRGLSNFNTGFPNCTGSITHRAATLAEILGANGYATFATGKWHLTPMDETSGAGPFDQWPLSRGFNRYYGFMQGETNQFYPELFYDNHPVDQPKSPEEGYHLTEDIIDKSIEFVRDQKSLVPEKPFFLYTCFGATHAPHQAPREFIEKYRGRFDEGWDKIREKWFARQKEMGVIPPNTDLAPRNPGVKPWDDLTDGEKKLAISLQEAFAGFLDHTDHHIGRLVDFLEEIGELDNTIIVLMSDNGASQEGGPIGVLDTFKAFNNIPEDLDESLERLDEIGGPNTNTNYPWGWAQAGNTPLKRYKQNTHGGGIRDPLIIHWPKSIADQGGFRQQYHHVTDIAPTILEVVGVEAPKEFKGVPQMPIHGTSLAYTFPAENYKEPTRKHVQYFEMFGHRGIWCDGWKAVAWHRQGTDFDDDEWELYHVDEDFSECHDLAKEKPEKLREMMDLWWAEAGKYGVLPLDDRTWQLFGGTPRPYTPRSRRRYVIYPPVSHINSDASPGIGNRSFTMTAEIERADDSANGVLAVYGAATSGLSFYIKDGRLAFDYNLFRHHYRAVSADPVPVGASAVAVRFERIGQRAKATLLINGAESGTVDIPQVMRMISAQGMDFGRDAGSPVSDDYEGPFPFTGVIKRIVIDVPKRVNPAQKRESQKAEAKAEMSRQ